jgi:hypothetical protein
MLRRFLLLAVSLLFFSCVCFALLLRPSFLLSPLLLADCTTLSLFFLFSALAFAAISPAICPVGLEPIVVEMEKHTMT